MKKINLRKKHNKTDSDTLELYITFLEMIDTLRSQNQFLNNQIKELEQRVTDLEISGKVGF